MDGTFTAADGFRNPDYVNAAGSIDHEEIDAQAEDFSHTGERLQRELGAQALQDTLLPSPRKAAKSIAQAEEYTGPPVVTSRVGRTVLAKTGEQQDRMPTDGIGAEKPRDNEAEPAYAEELAEPELATGDGDDDGDSPIDHILDSLDPDDEPGDGDAEPQDTEDHRIYDESADFDAQLAGRLPRNSVEIYKRVVLTDANTEIPTPEAAVELAKRIEVGLYAQKVADILDASAKGQLANHQAELIEERYEQLVAAKGGARANYTKAEIDELNAQAAADVDHMVGLALGHSDEHDELEALAKDGQAARDKLAGGVLRLSFKHAMRRERATRDETTDQPMDWVARGEDGVLRAVQTFDYKKDRDFTPHADSWIRQSLDLGRDNEHGPVRLPRHVLEDIRKVDRVAATLRSELQPGGKITLNDIASASNMTPEKVLELQKLGQSAVSLDRASSTSGRATTLWDVLIIEDETPLGGAEELHPDPVAEEAHIVERQDRIEAELDRLLGHYPKLHDTIIRRYGFHGHEPQTFREIAAERGVTHSAIQQQEAKALDILRAEGNIEIFEHLQ